MHPPAIGSILLASTNPDRLRAWYEQAFGVATDIDGFIRFGGVGLLVDGRDDVGTRSPEPGRVIVNLHVDDARATARHLDSLGVTWVATRLRAQDLARARRFYAEKLGLQPVETRPGGLRYQCADGFCFDVSAST